MSSMQHYTFHPMAMQLKLRIPLDIFHKHGAPAGRESILYTDPYIGYIYVKVDCGLIPFIRSP